MVLVIKEVFNLRPKTRTVVPKGTPVLILAYVRERVCQQRYIIGIGDVDVIAQDNVALQLSDVAIDSDSPAANHLTHIVKTLYLTWCKAHRTR